MLDTAVEHNRVVGRPFIAHIHEGEGSGGDKIEGFMFKEGAENFPWRNLGMSVGMAVKMPTVLHSVVP